MEARMRRAAWRWRRIPSLLLSLLLGASMLATTAPPAQAAPQTIRVSVDAAGAEGNGLSNTAAISTDGRYVAYASRATNLVTPDNNGTIIDIHVWDRLGGQVARASVASDGTQANGNSSQPAISADGCVVAFQSASSNLVSGVGGTQVYARNRCAGTTELVSAADGTATTAGSGTSTRPSISDDGRYVVFTSLATNLVSGDTNGVSDVFVRDRLTQRTERVSVSSTGAQLAAASDGGAISGDGNLVAFHTADATVVGGLNGASQVFVRQRTSTASVEVVSTGASGIGNSASTFASLSRNGSRIAFRSQATNLVAGDTNAVQDIFVRDRAAGTTRRVSVDANGTQGDAQSSAASISADGQVVVFQSTATNLVAGDANGRQDIFAHTLSSGVTELVSVSSSGTQANLDSFVVDGMAPALSGDGQYVVFHSGASNLVSGDTNGVIDVFLRQRDTTDTTPPQVTSSVSGTQGSNGWYVSDVTVTWSVSDPESGIASSTGCGTTTITTEGTTTLTCSATNGASLTTSQSATIKLDKTAPATTASASPAANANGWNNTAVTVTLTPSDATSGVALTQYRVDAGAVQTYTAPFAVSGEGTHSVEYFSRDNAGNVEATRSLTVRIDATAPTVTAGVSGTVGQSGWYVSDVTVAASGTDAGSGIEAGSCTSVTLTSEGASQPATVSCRDLAGNTGSASVSVSIDKTAPATTASASPAANANGWNNTDVAVTLSASDATSGVKEMTYSATGAQVIAVTTVAGASATISVTAEGQTVITFFARDNAGNAEVAKTATVKIDKTAPAVAASRTPGPNGNGWNNSDVTVSASGTDGLSGIEAGSCTTVVVSTEGAGQTATVSCRDLAGNTGSATATGISIDKTAPAVAFGAPTPGPNANGWNNSDVAIPFTSSDNLSGVASTTPGSSPLVLSAEGAAVSGTVTVTDQAGNTATVSSPAVKIDKTPPAVTASRTPGPNANGWNSSDVTVTATGTDGLSGIDAATCTSVTLASEGAGQSATVSCQDRAGNTGQATASDVNIDKTPPAVTASRTPEPNASGWNNTDVTVTATGTDGLSGIDAATCTTVVVSTEGAGQSATMSCQDRAGNTGQATVSGINVDKTPPAVTASRTPAPNANGWNNTDVTVTASGTDGLSGIEPGSCSTVVVSTEGAGQSATVSCRDVAGNTGSATATGISIDKTAPTVTANRTPGPNANGWNSSDVTVTASGTDGLSGIDTGTCTSVALSSEGAGQTATVSCQDRAGNQATATASDVNIDKTAPAVTASRTPAPNANGWNNTDVTVTASGTDGLSGIDAATCTTVVVSTEGAGQSATASCQDRAGNTGQATVSGINVDKTPPQVSVAGPTTLEVGQTGTWTASGGDAVSGIVSLDWDLDADGNFDDASGLSASGSFASAATVQVRLRATDRAGNAAISELTVVISSNLPPVITGVSGPTSPVALGTSTSVTASFSDSDSNQTHTCQIVWDDGATTNGTVTESGGSGTCSGTRTYAAPGVFRVVFTITDSGGAQATAAYEFVVVYDPSGGFVTGGGWINSPAGAHPADPAATGRANFGFVVKYQKNAKTPTGETEFRFGDLNLHGKSFSYLVISGSKAQFRGSGSLNGVSGYEFLVTVQDGQIRGGGGVDKFRIKIWNASGVVYDNVPGAPDDIDAANPQPIGGGSIVIHK